MREGQANIREGWEGGEGGEGSRLLAGCSMHEIPKLADIPSKAREQYKLCHSV